MILLIDNFDSFTYNLRACLGAHGAQVRVVRYDQFQLQDYLNEDISGVLISPGPGLPQDYPKNFAALKHWEIKKPILGICMGHQIIASYYGCSIKKASYPMHGKVRQVQHNSHQMFQNISSPTQVTRYHSLLVQEAKAPLLITATSESQEIMAMAHQQLPIWSVQFHPEAILTNEGQKLIDNWLRLL